MLLKLYNKHQILNLLILMLITKKIQLINNNLKTNKIIKRIVISIILKVLKMNSLIQMNNFVLRNIYSKI